MSAGDVLFRGWTGGTPSFKELEPQISFEPGNASSVFIQKRVSRRLICFSADKDSVVASLPVDNASLSSVYLDTAGAVQTKDLGGGWSLLSLDDVPFGTGFFLVTAVYAKDVPRVFAIGLPANTTITCTSGVAAIRYKTTNLETYDSGTGNCGAGLEIVVTPLAGAAYTNEPRGQNEAYWYRFSMRVNGVTFDHLEITGANLRNRTTFEVVEFIESVSTQPTEESLAPYYELSDQFSTVVNVFATQPSPGSWTIYVRRRFDLPAESYRRQPPATRWTLSGNILRLLVEDVVWKQWDVTGL